MTNEIHGLCDTRFLPFKEAFAQNFDAGLELGASLAVTYRGKMVVDLWAGYANRKKTRPWQENTIVQVFSSTKVPLILSILMLIDRRLLDLDKTVAHYWPEFGAGGKSEVTVRDALTHRAGVPGFDPPVSFEAVHDWTAITTYLAAQRHWFDGRKVLCYHPVTFGFILGEVLRRVDGRMPSQFFREEIAEKIGADFQMGLRDQSDVSRVTSPQWDLSPKYHERERQLGDKINNSVGLGPWMSWERLSAEMPATNGYANGRAIAQICSIVALGGEVNGVRYLSPRTLQEAVTEQVYGEDPVLGVLRLGLGLGLDSEGLRAPTPTAVHWGGYGGSWSLAEPKVGLSLGYACNNLVVNMPTMDPRLARIGMALEQLAPEL